MTRFLKRIVGTGIVVVVAGALLMALPPSRASRLTRAEPEPLLDAAAVLTLGGSRTLTQLDYIMTGKIRLLFFWKGSDDVGGGYIRRGVSHASPDVRLIEVLFGSDPEKAPRRINKWGAATEAIGDTASAFFGFMTQADSDSVEEAESDLSSRDEREAHAFSAILSYVDGEEAVSRSIPLLASTDYDIHQFEAARGLVTDRLASDGPVRRLDARTRRCPDARGFLQAVEEMVEVAISGQRTPASLCYVYNARNYTLTLKDVDSVDERTLDVERRNDTRLETTYHDLTRARFETVNHEGKRSSFELLLGRNGSLRGVPVQIVYQPNFWFRVELSLEDRSPGRF